MQVLGIAAVTPGQQGPNSVTHSGPASVRASEGPTGQEHAPFRGPHDYARQELVAPPNQLAFWLPVHVQVAKLHVFGFFWPDEWGIFSNAKPVRASPSYRRFSCPVRTTLREGGALAIGAPVAWELVHVFGFHRNELGTGERLDDVRP